MLSSWFELEPMPICSIDLAPLAGYRGKRGVSPPRVA